MIYQIGETIICSITVRDADAALKDVSISMNIDIEQITPQYAILITSAAMTKDGTGTYHYDFATSSAVYGRYKITYTATDGSRISCETDTFTLE